MENAAPVATDAVSSSRQRPVDPSRDASMDESSSSTDRSRQWCRLNGQLFTVNSVNFGWISFFAIVQLNFSASINITF